MPKNVVFKLTGDREIWDAFFKQTGAIEVDSIMEMAEVAMTFQSLSSVTDARVAVIGQGGGNTGCIAYICIIPTISPQGYISHFTKS